MALLTNKDWIPHGEQDSDGSPQVSYATFYLPPTWGFFAMRWLQRNRYI